MCLMLAMRTFVVDIGIPTLGSNPEVGFDTSNCLHDSQQNHQSLMPQIFICPNLGLDQSMGSDIDNNASPGPRY